MEAHQLSTKAARVGFDWEKVEDIFAKLEEEIGELRAAIQTHASSNQETDHARVREELGDLLFAVTNIARHLKVEPEAALKLTNRKFRKRFGYIEEKLRSGANRLKQLRSMKWRLFGSKQSESSRKRKCGSAAVQCGKPLAYRRAEPKKKREAEPREIVFGDSAVRQSLTALCGGRAAPCLLNYPLICSER